MWFRADECATVVESEIRIIPELADEMNRCASVETLQPGPVRTVIKETGLETIAGIASAVEIFADNRCAFPVRHSLYVYVGQIGAV